MEKKGKLHRKRSITLSVFLAFGFKSFLSKMAFFFPFEILRNSKNNICTISSSSDIHNVESL